MTWLTSNAKCISNLIFVLLPQRQLIVCNLQSIQKIRHIPAVIVQGRYDVVCPMETALELHRAWPEAEFEVVDDAGHSASEPGIVDRLIRATDRFADLK